VDGKKRKDEFLNLPFRAIKGFIKSSSLIVDSENSVFYFMMLWLLKEDKKTREITSDWKADSPHTLCSHEKTISSRYRSQCL
jgi:hypothetical protein